jgi:NADH dehydrogenase FAD-containing subunit
MVVGDAAAPALDGSAPLRMACATSTAMGAHAADALAASLRGSAYRPFRMTYLARNISLGRRDGVIDWVSPDDRPRNLIWTGRLAAAYKNMIGSFVWRSISGERIRSSAYQIAFLTPKLDLSKRTDNAHHYAGSK